MQNAFVESFKDRLRDECHNKHVFTTLADVERTIEAWRIDCNSARPHDRLTRLPPPVFGATRRLEEQQGVARSPWIESPARRITNEGKSGIGSSS